MSVTERFESSERQSSVAGTRRPSDQPEIELLQPGGRPRSLEPSSTTVTTGGGRRHGLLVMGAVGAMVVALTFVGSGDPGPTAAPTSSSLPATTATAAAPQPSVTVSVPTTAASTTTEPPTPLLDTPTGLVLVTLGSGGLLATDFDTGVERDLGLEQTNDAWQLIPRTGGVVVGSDQIVFVPFAGPSVVLDSYGAMVPSAHEGRLWVMSHPDGLREIDMSGATTAGPFPLPEDAYPIGGVTAGVIVSIAGDIFLVPADGSEATRVSTGYPIAAGGDLVASYECGQDLECGLHLRDLAAGTDRIATRPDGGVFMPYSIGSLSPDGSWLVVAGPGPSSTPLFVIDTATGISTVVPSESTGYNVWPITWSPDGQWLLWADQFSGVQAWPVGASESVDLPVDVGNVNAFAVVSA
jgi:hypothetical protein